MLRIEGDSAPLFCRDLPPALRTAPPLWALLVSWQQQSCGWLELDCWSRLYGRPEWPDKSHLLITLRVRVCQSLFLWEVGVAGWQCILSECSPLWGKGYLLPSACWACEMLPGWENSAQHPLPQQPQGTTHEKASFSSGLPELRKVFRPFFAVFTWMDVFSLQHFMEKLVY